MPGVAGPAGPALVCPSLPFLRPAPLARKLFEHRLFVRPFFGVVPVPYVLPVCFACWLFFSPSFRNPDRGLRRPCFEGRE